MDIRHFRTADALVDPAHDIAQNPLAIVVELGLNFVWRPVRPANRNGEEVGKMRRAAPGELFLSGSRHRPCDNAPRATGGRRRGHPGGIRPGKRMHDLLREHIGHPVRRGPHALADLRPPRQPAGDANVDIGILVGLIQSVFFMSFLRTIGPASMDV